VALVLFQSDNVHCQINGNFHSQPIIPFPVDISTITGWISGVKSLFRPPISPTMTNIYINFVILLKPGPGAIKHENFLKYEKILNCHGLKCIRICVEMP
jgi:hypothetical protein